jgi:hypothetical protein
MTISGPGGTIALGAGAGVDKGGVTTAYDEDKQTTTTGADGAVLQNLHPGQTGTITVRLLKTSPSNALLSNLYNFQRASSANWAQNVMQGADAVRGDTINGVSMGFVKFPDVTWAEDGAALEWQFRGILREQLGSGSADLSLP